MICQKKTDEHLTCPADSKHRDTSAVYFTAERNFTDFSEYSALPRSMKLCHIDNGSGIQSTLHQNKACWHKSFRDKYNSTKLKILREKLDLKFDVTNESIAKWEQHYLKILQWKAFPKTFVSPAATNELWEVQTFSLEAQVQSAAFLLNDTRLLTKLSSSDMIAQEAKYHLRCLIHRHNRVQSHSEKQKHSMMTILFQIA